MLYEARIRRIDMVLCKKQPDLQLFCDDVHSSQNLSAITRSCDGAGVLYLYYATKDNKAVRVHKSITQGAHRWVERERIDTEKKFSFLKQKKDEGYQIFVTHLDENAVSFREVDYTRPTLIIVGNEKEGVSPQVAAMADRSIVIPMQGMVQSLNVSVATALVLYEAQRQREEAGLYDTPQLLLEQRERLKASWLYRDTIVRRSKGTIVQPG
ncbi:TrmH family RNA methyltransferase [Sulfurovum sp. ST-21]|uniref:tRNA (guanosine(18)-2'-O)-methyltransferase n=1 Tax=Sulfurovum indicum TaxID=2779528 RepID=A0A7M1S0L2_9BACT|nr:TrmH family RNA methyltransferase [Sulfurovum indicum]QOR61045.1 tRNA (guanine-N2)-dimethyltransferase [Sulfurovum indicum]